MLMSLELLKSKTERTLIEAHRGEKVTVTLEVTVTSGQYPDASQKSHLDVIYETR